MKKQKVLIIGAGQHANVVAYNLHEQGVYEIAGFLTSDTTTEGEYLGYPLVSSYKNFDIEDTELLRHRFNTCLFHVGFGAMKYRKAVYDFFVSQGWTAVNIIHPSAVVSADAKLGNGVLIEAGCLITPNPIIGNNVVVNTGSQVNHDDIIHDHVYIASGVVTSSKIEIGEETLIDDGVIIAMSRKVGSNCIIGAGSVVTRDIPSGVIAYGNPCRVIRKND